MQRQSEQAHADRTHPRTAASTGERPSTDAYDATVEVRPSVVLGRLEETLFGWQHGEVADPIFRGLWAELLSNRKFGGHDEPAAARRTATVIAHIRSDVFHEYLDANPRPPTFGVLNPWYRVVEAGDPYYCHDNSVSFVGGQSQRIEVRDENGWSGIGQAGLRLQEGHTYTGYLIARSEGAVRTRVALGPLDGQQETVSLGSHGSDWERREFTFTPTATSDNGEFRIECSGAGTSWFGAVSLMDADHEDGFRPDVLRAVAELQPSIIRWGGNTSQYYRWREGVGPREKRPPLMDAWDSLITHDFGTHEFVDYCRRVGAEPFIVVNAGDGTPEEAAQWVEYCNAPADRGLGRLRAEHGSAQPFGVRLWAIGNEVYGNWVIGHCDPETYGRRAARIAEAMRAIDPEIELVLVGDFNDPQWNRRALGEAASVVDHLTLHWYPRVTSGVPAGAVEDHQIHDPAERDVLTEIAGFAEELHRGLRAAHDQIDDTAEGRAIAVALTEWSLMLEVQGARPQRESWGRIKDMRDAVFVASAMNVLVRDPALAATSTYTRLHRYGIYHDQRGFFYSPDVLALRLLRQELGPSSVETEVRSPQLQTAAGQSVSTLDVSATRHENGSIALVLVNRDPERSARIRVETTESAYRLERLRLLAGRSPVDANTMDDPSNVTVRDSAEATLDEITLPAWSIAVLVASEAVATDPQDGA